eukprot:m.182598 g.182598  ORF g.182598 m.182598 type:complete len:848 (+) comp15529_c0_seq3:461-3004(+)
MISQKQARATVEHVQRARRAVVQGDYRSSVAGFLNAIATSPEVAENISAELTCALRWYTAELAATGKSNAAVWMYKNVIDVLPEESYTAEIWHDFSALKYTNGETEEALECIEKALDLDRASVHLEDLRALAVERWHFRMLNDRDRNTAFESAINRALHGSDSKIVLDIGTGTGLLSIYAVRAGAKHVYACEANPVMAHIAKGCLRDNKVSSSDVTLWVTHSEEIILAPSEKELKQSCSTPKQALLPKRVDVIVAELIDSGLLGENIVTTLLHASKNFLAPGGKIIPERADITLQLLESTQIANHMSYTRKDGENVFCLEEPYICCMLSEMEHSCLSLPQSNARTIYFARDPTECPKDLVEIPVTKNGKLHCVGMWYNVHVDNSASFNTEPRRGRDCGWDQAMLFVNSQDSNFDVCEGDTVILEVSHTIKSIVVEVKEIRKNKNNIQQQKDHTKRSDVACVTDEVEQMGLTSLKEYELTLMNDIDEPSRVSQVLSTQNTKLKECIVLSSIFSMTCLQILSDLKENKIDSTMNLSWIIPPSTSHEAVTFIRKFAARKGIELEIYDSSSSKPSVVDGKNGSVCKLVSSWELGQAVLSSLSNTIASPPQLDQQKSVMNSGEDPIPKSHAKQMSGNGDIQHKNEEFRFCRVMVALLVLPSGLLDEGMLQFLASNSALLQDMKMVPHSLRICGVVVESSSLAKLNSVFEPSVSGVNLTRINKFAVSRLSEINLESMQDVTELSPVFRVPKLEVTKLNDSVHFEVQVPVKVKGKPNAIVYWFEYLSQEENSGSNNIILSTGPCHCGGSKSSTHLQVAQMLEHSLVEDGTHLSVAFVWKGAAEPTPYFSILSPK